MNARAPVYPLVPFKRASAVRARSKPERLRSVEGANKLALEAGQWKLLPADFIPSFTIHALIPVGRVASADLAFVIDQIWRLHCFEHARR